MNQFNYLSVKTPDANMIAVYDSFRSGENGADYDIFRNREDVKANKDLPEIESIVRQILKPRRLGTLPQGHTDEFIDDSGGINAGFFRPETPQFDIPADMKWANNFVAIPGKKKPPKFRGSYGTWLRLFCAQWDRKTIVLFDGFDKMGHDGSWQSEPRLNAIVQPIWTQFRRLYEAVEGFADYFVNDPHIGFSRRGDKTRCAEVQLDQYEV